MSDFSAAPSVSEDHKCLSHEHRAALRPPGSLGVGFESNSAASSYMLGVMHQRPSYMLTGVSGKTTHGTRIANVLDVIRIAAEWRKRGIIQIQIEDDEGRSYDPQEFERVHAPRT